jgi:hypothetical protein
LGERAGSGGGGGGVSTMRTIRWAHHGPNRHRARARP